MGNATYTLRHRPTGWVLVELPVVKELPQGIVVDIAGAELLLTHLRMQELQTAVDRDPHTLALVLRLCAECSGSRRRGRSLPTCGQRSDEQVPQGASPGQHRVCPERGLWQPDESYTRTFTVPRSQVIASAGHLCVAARVTVPRNPSHAGCGISLYVDREEVPR